MTTHAAIRHLCNQWSGAILDALPQDGTPRTVQQIAQAAGCTEQTASWVMGAMPNTFKRRKMTNAEARDHGQTSGTLWMRHPLVVKADP